MSPSKESPVFSEREIHSERNSSAGLEKQTTILQTAPGVGHMARTPLAWTLEAKSGSQLVVSKKRGTSVLKLQGTKFSHQPVSLEEDLKPQMRSWSQPTTGYQPVRLSTVDSVNLYADS